MPLLQIPSDLGGLSACTGVIDVRKAGGDQKGIEHLQQITFTIYDLPPSNNERLYDASVLLTKFVCPKSAYASGMTLNPNDIITVVTNSDRLPVMIYNHTLRLGAYQKTNFYPAAFRWQAFVKSHIFLIIFMAVCWLALPLLLILLNNYGNGPVRAKKDQECERLTAWIVQNVNVDPQPVQVNNYMSI